MASPKAAEPADSAVDVAEETQATSEPAESEPEAVEPAEESKAAEPAGAGPRKPKHRFESFEATRPDGVVVRVKRNIDTGKQTVVEAVSARIEPTSSDGADESGNPASADSAKRKPGRPKAE